MNRRKILKNLTIISAGTVILPSCGFFSEKASISLNNLNITEKQKNLVAELAGVLIPDGEIPGARQLNVQDFVWVMVDDCLEKTNQEKFLKGLDQFESLSTKNAGRAFTKLPFGKQTQLLQSFSVDSKDPELADMHYCLNTVKRFTIQGYLKSKYIMTEIMPYQLIPGSYDPCELISNLKSVNIHA
jgi:hypothetical protein